MNPNDLLAQQTALANQALQNAQQWWLGIMAIQLAFFILAMWVTYMFYARLRDISVELRNFRISYEFAHSPERDSARRIHTGSDSSSQENPFSQSADDAKYRPK